MKISVPNDEKPLSPLHKLYLIVCVAVVHVFFIVKGIVVSFWSLFKSLNLRVFRPENIIFVTFPLLVFGLYCAAWKLQLVQNAEYANEKGYELLATYEFLNKPLPDEFFSMVDLSCNAEGAVIDLADKNQVLSTKYSVTNNSDYPLLLRPGGQYAIHIRPRLWNAEMSTPLKEDFKISLDLGDVALIDAKSSYSGVLSIQSEAIENAPEASKYMVIGAVQEGVKWVSSRGCKFEVAHDK